MGKYVLRRLAYGFVILLGVNLVTFFLFFQVNTPDDMARLNIGGKRVTAEQIQKWKVERGYDKPMYWNERRQGVDQVTDTIFWDRSVSLFALDFGRADSESAGDIGSEVRSRMAVSLQLALPVFILQLIVSTVFALVLVFFLATRAIEKMSIGQSILAGMDKVMNPLWLRLDDFVRVVIAAFLGSPRFQCNK